MRSDVLYTTLKREDVAKWLNSMGIAAFVLECRLPSDEHDNAEDVPLIDAMRAMRVIRGSGAGIRYR